MSKKQEGGLGAILRMGKDPSSGYTRLRTGLPWVTESGQYSFDASEIEKIVKGLPFHYVPFGNWQHTSKKLVRPDTATKQENEGGEEIDQFQPTLMLSYASTQDQPVTVKGQLTPPIVLKIFTDDAMSCFQIHVIGTTSGLWEKIQAMTGRERTNVYKFSLNDDPELWNEEAWRPFIRRATNIRRREKMKTGEKTPSSVLAITAGVPQEDFEPRDKESAVNETLSRLKGRFYLVLGRRLEPGESYLGLKYSKKEKIDGRKSS